MSIFTGKTHIFNLANALNERYYLAYTQNIDQYPLGKLYIQYNASTTQTLEMIDAVFDVFLAWGEYSSSTIIVPIQRWMRFYPSDPVTDGAWTSFSYSNYEIPLSVLPYNWDTILKAAGYLGGIDDKIDVPEITKFETIKWSDIEAWYIQRVKILNLMTLPGRFIYYNAEINTYIKSVNSHDTWAAALDEYNSLSWMATSAHVPVFKLENGFNLVDQYLIEIIRSDLIFHAPYSESTLNIYGLGGQNSSFSEGLYYQYGYFTNWGNTGDNISDIWASRPDGDYYRWFAISSSTQAAQTQANLSLYPDDQLITPEPPSESSSSYNNNIQLIFCTWNIPDLPTIELEE